MKYANTEDEDLKPYSIAELAQAYGVSSKTLRNWLDPFQSILGERRGRYYNIVQVDIIFAKLGKPSSLDT